MSMFKGLEIGGYWKPHHPSYTQMDRRGGQFVQITADAGEAPWPFETGGFDVVYASHIIEHMEEGKTDNFMGEAYRILKPGGILKLATPDFARVAEAYLKVRDLEFEIGADKIKNIIAGEPSSHGPYMHHLSVWDRLKMTRALTSAGFVDIRFLNVNPRYLEEDFIREFGIGPHETRKMYEMYLECSKPGEVDNK